MSAIVPAARIPTPTGRGKLIAAFCGLCATHFDVGATHNQIAPRFLFKCPKNDCGGLVIGRFVLNMEELMEWYRECDAFFAENERIRDERVAAGLPRVPELPPEIMRAPEPEAASDPTASPIIVPGR